MNRLSGTVSPKYAPGSRPASSLSARKYSTNPAAKNFLDAFEKRQKLPPTLSPQRRDLESKVLLGFLPKDVASIYEDIPGLSPRAVLGEISEHLVTAAKVEAKEVLGFWGTKLAARSAQVGMLTVLLLLLSPVTGLSLTLSLAIIVAVVGGLTAFGIVAQKLVARRRLRSDTPSAVHLREVRTQLVSLEQYLSTCRRDSDLHAAVYKQTRKVIAQIDATWMHLLGEAVNNAKMPLITVFTTIFHLLRWSSPGVRVSNFLRSKDLIARHPTA